jgi:hypothetical protein
MVRNLGNRCPSLRCISLVMERKWVLSSSDDWRVRPGDINLALLSEENVSRR